MVRVALVGVGVMGSKHAKILKMMAEEGKCEFVACCDPIKKKVEKIAKETNTKGYQDVERMLSEERLDALIIATPTSQHSKVALSAIRKGINVLIEKPISLCYEESLEVYEESKKYGTMVGAGMTEVFNSAVENLKWMIEKRNLTLNTAIFNRLGFKNPRNDFTDTDVVYDLMIHDVSVILEVLGYPTMRVIGARSLRLNKKSGFHDAATALLTDGKSNIVLNASRVSEMKVRNFYMDFNELYLQGDYMDQKLNIFSSSTFEFSEASTNLWYNMAFNHTTTRYANNPLYDEDLDFISAIKNSRQPKVGPDQWISIMKIMNEIESHLSQ